MPSSEKTWRDITFLHLIFGLSALGMLIATLWMLYADHNRQWKGYQREFRRIDAWRTESRLREEQTRDHSERLRMATEELNANKATVPPAALIDEFREAVLNEEPDFNWEPIQAAYAALVDQPSAARRGALIDQLGAILDGLKVREENDLRELKFARADFDVVKSELGIAIGQGVAPEKEAELRARVEAKEAIVRERTSDYEATKVYHEALQKLISKINEPVDRAQKALDALNSEIAKLHETLKEQRITRGQSMLEWPILSAFNSPDKIDQIWLPDLKVDYNFTKVARFDRCITCHRGIQRTAAGAADKPFIPHQQQLTIELSTERQPLDQEGQPLRPTMDRLNDFLDAAYGMLLADRGLLNKNDVTVRVVYPETPAARAGLIVGDVIEQVGDAPVIDRQSALTFLLDQVEWGKPLELTVRRGLPHPYASHPRLDLYLGSFSPHKMMEFGCTTCHEGQGSATDFRWAAHSPNNPLQRREWQEKYGWVSSHYVGMGITHLWDFPMHPKRFAESTCLKCHFDVVELGPSDRFPDAPAPKVLRGYELVKTYGCFGCHEINGFDGPDRRVGPDLRAEPGYYAAAQQLLTDANLTDEQRRLAEIIAAHPDRMQDRKRLAELIEADQAAGKTGGEATLSSQSHNLANILGADTATPGKLRKVGPSLRFVGQKLDRNFLYNWIREPKQFRPNTRMPQFFGQWKHLNEKIDADHADAAHGEAGDSDESDDPFGVAVASRYEPVEIYALTEYLLNNSQPFNYDELPATSDAERGKRLFQTRGCLACHQHHDFPEAKHPQSTFGPNLSRIGAKLSGKGKEGKRWLYTWLRQPNRYHARTRMPDLKLDPYTEGSGEKAVQVDPAADIVAFLFASSEPWQAVDVPEIASLLPALDDLALEYLSKTFTESQARRYLKNGIPDSLAAELKGAELSLVGQGQMSTAKKLAYVGRKSVSKFGCFGCHDVPGFEDAKPIGTTLADWGRKDTSRLAFEQINQYIAHDLGDGHELKIEDLDPDTGFFVSALMHHRREGFIWEKLREPRSYDYEKTAVEGYNERLRMPKFPLAQDEIEAIMTFVLGLVAEPPMQKYVYNPPPRRAAVLAGKQMLEQFNCGGCHTLKMESWDFSYDPAKFASYFGSSAPYSFNFFTPHFTPEQIAKSKKVDARGLGHGTVTGMPMTDAKGQLVVDEHPDEEFPVNYFELWKPTVINGEPWYVGGPSMMVPVDAITKKRPPLGGYLARYLQPVLLAQAAGTNAKPSDAWGWVPPPLVREGTKVQTDWLHDFLLDPYPIRPSTVLRMPKFTMSPQDASTLVDYFAAVDGAEYPYEFDPRTRRGHLAAVEAKHPGFLNDALRVVTDNNYCVKCHLVGDYRPPGSATALAPDLSRVYRRLRPGFLRRWLAKPKSLLPYSGMPDNFEKPLSQELFKGDRLEQLDGVVDLLLNYDRFMKKKTSISSMVKPPPATAQTESGG